jgi:hypothetical protein
MRRILLEMKTPPLLMPLISDVKFKHLKKGVKYLIAKKKKEKYEHYLE